MGGGALLTDHVTATSGSRESPLCPGIEKQGQRTTRLGHKETPGVFLLPLPEPILSPFALNHTAEEGRLGLFLLYLLELRNPILTDGRPSCLTLGSHETSEHSIKPGPILSFLASVHALGWPGGKGVGILRLQQPGSVCPDFPPGSMLPRSDLLG